MGNIGGLGFGSSDILAVTQMQAQDKSVAGSSNTSVLNSFSTMLSGLLGISSLGNLMGSNAMGMSPLYGLMGFFSNQTMPIQFTGLGIAANMGTFLQPAMDFNGIMTGMAAAQLTQELKGVQGQLDQANVELQNASNEVNQLNTQIANLQNSRPSMFMFGFNRYKITQLQQKLQEAQHKYNQASDKVCTLNKKKAELENKLNTLKKTEKS